MLNFKSPYTEPSLPNIVNSFQFPKIEFPNPGEWAVDAANKFADAVISEFMKIFTTSFYKFLVVVEQSSFEICLIVGLIALILYIFGWEKAKKIATLSPAIYIILQIFFSVWFGI